MLQLLRREHRLQVVGKAFADATFPRDCLGAVTLSRQLSASLALIVSFSRSRGTLFSKILRVISTLGAILMLF